MDAATEPTADTETAQTEPSQTEPSRAETAIIQPGHSSPGHRLNRFPPDLPEGMLPAGTKGRILTSALLAFADRGFYGTSIRTIAEGAGINSATLYSHYASKEQVLAVLVTMGSQELLGRIEHALADADAITTAKPGTDANTGADANASTARLEAIIRATSLAHARYPLLAVVTNSEFHALSPEPAQPAQAPTKASAQLLRSILVEGQSDGAFEIADVDAAAHALESMVQQIPQWISRAADDPEEVAAAYVLIARRIVGAHPAI